LSKCAPPEELFNTFNTLKRKTGSQIQLKHPAASDIFYLFFLEKAEFVQNKYIIRTKPILNNKKQ
jgi:hypothetical protein